MKLEVHRISSQTDSTNGVLFESTSDGLKFLCYTLEDEHRDIKVMGETRIPEGEYVLKLRTEGGYHNKYSNRFGDMHKGMIHVQDVPNFKWILWHCGNTDEDTGGCLLLGDTQTNNIVEANGFIGSSTQAYKRIYPIVANAILSGEEVKVKYINY